MTPTGGGARTALITGGTRGLGRALVTAFASRGYRVYATGRDAPALASLERDMAAGGFDVIAARSDVTSVDDNAALARRIAGDGRRLDVVVHNAALLGQGKTLLAEYSPEAFRRVMDANVFGPFDLTRQLLPVLAPDAALLFVSSGVSAGPRVRWGAYNVSKIALDGLAGIWARELRDRGIRVYVVDPGKMRTSMRAHAYPDEDPRTLDPPEARAFAFVRLAEEWTLAQSGARVKAEELDEDDRIMTAGQ